MIAYIYDGSFEGLLTAIYHAFYAEIKPDEIKSSDDYRENFLMAKIDIKTDLDKSQRVYQAIEDKISYNSLKKVFYAYLSELPDSEMKIFRYLQIGFKLGADVDLNLANEDVLNIHNINKKVAKERHRLIGLLRFKRVKDILYAQVEPDHNVIALMAPHFQARLREENFIIHDLKRELMVFYNKKEWLIKDSLTADLSLEPDQQGYYEELWKVYFKAISIERKANIKLQKKNMPMRYWKHLTEKS